MCRIASTRLSDNCQAVGREHYSTLNAEEVGAINDLGRGRLQLTQTTVVKTYQKMIVKGQMIFSRNTVRVTKHNSYTVAYYQPQFSEHIQYGYVLRFVIYPPNATENPDNMVLLLPLRTQPSKYLQEIPLPPSIKPYAAILFNDFSTFEIEDRIIAIYTEDIIMKCFNTSTYEQLQMTSIVNEVERVL